MMRIEFAPALILVAALFFVGEAAGQASETNSRSCIRTFQESNAARESMNKDKAEATNIVSEISRRLGISAEATVVPCSYAKKAHAWFLADDPARRDVPSGYYIIFNPTWLRETVGKEPVQATFVFGHEFGHIVNQHFTTRTRIEDAQKEFEADRFGACAVSRLGGDLATLEDLVKRLRTEKGTGNSPYPSAAESLISLKKAFHDCIATAGTGEMGDTLRKIIAYIGKGECPASIYNSLLLAQCKKQIDVWKDFMVSLGEFKDVEFVRRETFQGTRVEWYRVIFGKSELMWSIGLDAQGKVNVNWSPA